MAGKLQHKKVLNPQEIIKVNWANWKEDVAEWEKRKAQLRAQLDKLNKKSIKYKILNTLFLKKCIYQENYFMLRADDIHHAQRAYYQKLAKESEQTK